MKRYNIDCDEEYPVYSIRDIDPDDGPPNPGDDYSIEIPAKTRSRYRKIVSAYNDMQEELRELYSFIEDREAPAAAIADRAKRDAWIAAGGITYAVTTAFCETASVKNYAEKKKSKP